MPKVIDLPTATDMDDADFFLMEESTGGTKKITRGNAVNKYLSFYPIGIASISDLNTATTNGSSALYFSADVVVGGVTIPRYSRGFTINPHGSEDGVIMVVDASRNFYQGFRNGTTWNVRTDKITQVNNVVTRESGATLTGSYLVMSNKVAYLYITLSADTTYGAGSNLFKGVVASSYKPSVGGVGIGYYGTTALPLSIDGNGNITVRVVGGSIASGAMLGTSLMYIMQ